MLCFRSLKYTITTFLINLAFSKFFSWTLSNSTLFFFCLFWILVKKTLLISLKLRSISKLTLKQLMLPTLLSSKFWYYLFTMELSNEVMETWSENKNRNNINNQVSRRKSKVLCQLPFHLELGIFLEILSKFWQTSNLFNAQLGLELETTEIKGSTKKMSDWEK